MRFSVQVSITLWKDNVSTFPRLRKCGSAMLIRTLCTVLAATAALAGGARASALIDRDATSPKLQVDAQGRAMLTYVANGAERHVLVLPDAINAKPPARGTKQVAFKIDYGGGWGFYHKVLWKNFKNACRPYDGPPL